MIHPTYTLPPDTLSITDISILPLLSPAVIPTISCKSLHSLADKSGFSPFDSKKYSVIDFIFLANSKMRFIFSANGNKPAAICSHKNTSIQPSCIFSTYNFAPAVSLQSPFFCANVENKLPTAFNADVNSLISIGLECSTCIFSTVSFASISSIMYLMTKIAVLNI